ncbi:MAG: hypothetical protein E7331_01225 [Clostridiales bacterium]|nr:hypothetical protein [Clostridiales bacterium]
MWNNIGGKIKTLSKVICWIGIIVSIILALIIWIGGSESSRPYDYYGNNRYSYSYRSSAPSSFLSGLIVLVVGCLGSWIGAFFSYGFGELIESTVATAENNRFIYHSLSKKSASQSTRS